MVETQTRDESQTQSLLFSVTVTVGYFLQMIRHISDYDLCFFELQIYETYDPVS